MLNHSTAYKRDELHGILWSQITVSYNVPYYLECALETFELDNLRNDTTYGEKGAWGKKIRLVATVLW